MGQKIAYGVGMLANNLQAAALPAMVVILNLGLKMNPYWVGLATMLPRLVDAITDPAIGYLSDSSNTRWGRRRPFMFCGAISAGILFALMWQVPAGYSDTAYFWYFFLAFAIYFITYTSYSTPFVALGFELSSDYHERTRLQAIANSMGQLPWIAVPWFYSLMASSLFTDKVHGARVLAIWVGGAICLFGLVPAIFCRERISPNTKPAEAISLTSLIKNISLAFQCRPFLILCVATFLVFNGYQLGSSFTLYVLIYHMFEGQDAGAGELFGLYGTATAGFALLAIRLSTLLSRDIGKRPAIQVMLGVSTLGYALKWFSYSKNDPIWLIVSCPFIACGIGTLFTLMASMIADVCDYDQLRTGQRREGMLGAIYWWMVKLGNAISAFLFGILLNYSEFDVELEAQSTNTLGLLQVMDVGIPILSTGAAIFLLSGYRITESYAEEIRAELSNSNPPESPETS